MYESVWLGDLSDSWSFVLSDALVLHWNGSCEASGEATLKCNHTMPDVGIG